MVIVFNLISFAADSAQTKHVLTASNSAGKPRKKSNEESEKNLLPPPCKPIRPCLSPRPGKP
jgi:hypothetical protein